MITYTNIQSFDDIAFGEYLKLPGYSQSYLKAEKNGIAPGVNVTDNMRLGTMVDNILTNPKEVDYDSDLFDAGKSIALEIRKHWGAFIDRFSKQKNYVAEAEYQGFYMPVRGRLDFLLPKLAVIDLKCTNTKLKAIPGLVEFMGYENQLWHYASLSQVKRAYLLIYSRPDKETKLFTVDVSNPVNYFWADKITKFGSVKNEN